MKQQKICQLWIVKLMDGLELLLLSVLLVKITIVPILRAGIGMLDGVLNLIPSAKVSVLGLERNEETLEVRTYYKN